jgi:hypothetical protein
MLDTALYEVYIDKGDHTDSIYDRLAPAEISALNYSKLFHTEAGEIWEQIAGLIYKEFGTNLPHYNPGKLIMVKNRKGLFGETRIDGTILINQDTYLNQNPVFARVLLHEMLHQGSPTQLAAYRQDKEVRFLRSGYFMVQYPQRPDVAKVRGSWLNEAVIEHTCDRIYPVVAELACLTPVDSYKYYPLPRMLYELLLNELALLGGNSNGYKSKSKMIAGLDKIYPGVFPETIDTVENIDKLIATANFRYNTEMPFMALLTFLRGKNSYKELHETITYVPDSFAKIDDTTLGDYIRFLTKGSREKGYLPIVTINDKNGRYSIQYEFIGQGTDGPPFKISRWREATA